MNPLTVEWVLGWKGGRKGVGGEEAGCKREGGGEWAEVLEVLVCHVGRSQALSLMAALQQTNKQKKAEGRKDYVRTTLNSPRRAGEGST